MFDNAPLLISFGSIVDRMFVVALSLIIFVYGVTAAMYIYNEFDKLFSVERVRKFFKLKPKPKNEPEVHELISESESPVLYEVMWSNDLASTYAATSRRRIVRDPREGARDLINENGDGYIRYRVWLSETQPWGLATWQTRPPLELPKFPDLKYDEVFGKHSASIPTVKVEDDTDK